MNTSKKINNNNNNNSSKREDLVLDTEQQTVYDTAYACLLLKSSSSPEEDNAVTCIDFLAPLPTIVSMEAPPPPPAAAAAASRRRRQRRRQNNRSSSSIRHRNRSSRGTSRRSLSRPASAAESESSSTDAATNLAAASTTGTTTEASAMSDNNNNQQNEEEQEEQEEEEEERSSASNNSEEEEEEEPPVTTIVTPMRGHHALFRVLEEMEGLEKEEQGLLEQSPLTKQLTFLLTKHNSNNNNNTNNSNAAAAVAVGGASSTAYSVGTTTATATATATAAAAHQSQHQYYYESSRQAVESLRQAGRAVPRRVCQHPFRKNDIVWVCRTCQADETCVLCHSCFSQSNHEGHDVAFYHAQAGGCCDCGDPDAWSPDGFCPHHGPQAAAAAAGSDGSASSALPPGMVHRVRGVVPATVDWLVQEIAMQAEAAFARAHPPRPPRAQQSQRNKRKSLASSSSSTSETMTTVPVAATVAATTARETGAATAPLEPAAEATTTTTTEPTPMSPASTAGEGMDVDQVEEEGQGDGSSGVASVAAAASVSVDNNNLHEDDMDEQLFVGDDDDDVEDVTFPGMNAPTNPNTRNALAALNNPAAAMRPHVFSPMAASSGAADRSLSSLQALGADAEERAAEIGRLGATGHGLYIVLHADDIHSTPQLLDAVREFLGSNNYYTDTLLQKMIRSLRQYGQLIVWGTMETAAEVGMTNVHLWMDGDKAACSRVGAVVLERASRLTKHGLFCGILTRDQLVMEQRAVALLQWLSEVARSCDPLCQTVAECILPQRHLVPLLRADFKMSARVTKAWYSLLLTLLAVPTFKSHLAAAYCDTYRSVTAKYARGMGVMERSGYTLSVQFLNRVTYVVDLVQGRDLLGKLGKSLLETLLVARLEPSISNSTTADSPFTAWGQQRARQAHTDQGMMFLMRTATLQDGVVADAVGTTGLANTNVAGLPDSPPDSLVATGTGSSSSTALMAAAAIARRAAAIRRLNPNHFVLTHRRYSPCISDLKCVLNVKGMPRLFACQGGSFLRDWIDTLSSAQLMDPQVWRHWMQGHVEDESRGWVGAFNASISLGSLFERLLGWEDEEPSPIADPSSPLSRDLLSCSELTYFILSHGVFSWQRREMLLYEPTPNSSAVEPYRRCPASLPYSTIAAKHGTTLAMRQLPVSQATPFSFHLPLHRFVAGCFRELCLRKDDKVNGVVSLMDRLRRKLPVEDYEDLFLGLMEFPLVIITRAAQVRAGLWRRNGPGLNDQVLNYAEPPFCRTMRDADLLLIQLSVLGCIPYQQKSLSPRQHRHSDVGMARFVNLMLHRLGVFDFCGLAKAPNQNIEQYQEGIEQRLYPREVVQDESGTDPGTEVALPWTYSPARDTNSSLVLLEEFLHAIIVFTSELPHVVPANQEDHTRQARWRLHREVVHRLASGPKTHSELLEVHHVLSHWDNVLLSEEGKQINPDDATGAALGTVLDHIADRKSSRGKMEPDKWEMKRSAWDEYDPSFYHISLRMHQTAADSRPKPKAEPNSPLGFEPKAYAPAPATAHPFFNRLRRDATADTTVMAIVYRVLHMHLRENVDKDLTDMRGKAAYEKEKSETALARAVHLLTLGAFGWKDAVADDPQWRNHGGGSPGSLFADWSTDCPAPVAGDWVSKVLLANPRDLMDCEWYEGEETALVLLRRLASSGGVAGGFFAQDSYVRGGAAWICDFARRNSIEADSMFRPAQAAVETPEAEGNSETALQQRKRLAREKAMAKMKAQAAAFASMMEVDIGEEEDTTGKNSEASSIAGPPPVPLQAPGTPNRPIRAASFGSAHSTASSVLTISSDITGLPNIVNLAEGASATTEERPAVPDRLLKDRPRCIICNDEDTADSRAHDRAEGDDGEGQRKRSRRRTENALGFVGYIQPSTVLKGGGGPPPDLESPISPVREFVGSHIALCGHAVHSECCESYLATVSHREDRAIGKRDEFRCPLCQRLSNCLVPFIDVAVDWIASPTCLPTNTSGPGAQLGKSESDTDPMQLDSPAEGATLVSLHDYLSNTPWWVSRNSRNIVWDGQSAFLDRQLAASVGNLAEMSPTSRRQARRRIRPLSKKDLYAAWNAMMRTPRFVRRRLRRASTSSKGGDAVPASVPEPEESAGETVVWRRFMDQVSDLSYRADSKRLGDDHLHDLFGEFRHYIVEKYAYNMANRFSGGEPAEWPYCVFRQSLSDQRRQEMSREKLLSKLLLSIQAFTYSCCCEAFEAKRMFRKSVASSSKAAGLRQELSVEACFSRFGIVGLACDGRLVVLPRPSAEVDNGFQVFNGRLGKLRYFCLAVMAAAGAVAADLVQLVVAFPVNSDVSGISSLDDGEKPHRAPIAYPMLLGNVLTHVVAAMCATCGRGRARSDSLDLAWPAPFNTRGSFAVSNDTLCSKQLDSVIEDCEGFLKLGLLARILQVLLGRMQVSPAGYSNSRAVLAAVESYAATLALQEATLENKWTRSCVRLLEYALSNQAAAAPTETSTSSYIPPPELIQRVSIAAASAACDFLADAGTILQILLPGVMARYHNGSELPSEIMGNDGGSSLETFEKLRFYFNLEPIDEMLDSDRTKEIIANWYDCAIRNSQISLGRVDGVAPGNASTAATLRSRLYRTQGFRDYDWPSPGAVDTSDIKTGSRDKDQHGEKAESSAEQPEDESSTSMQVESMRGASSQASTTTNVFREKAPPALVTFSAKKTVPLLGGFVPDLQQAETHPRVTVMPTSYTDLYAELGTLLPECEQTAVCLICGEVLNAGGKGECTRHSYKCGAGAGMFFLLQECSGLIMHKSKAAYIHSPYVDSHGETPQYRGRPLNLDLDRYEHLREVWYGHSVRQQVVAERASSRQVILPDFY